MVTITNIWKRGADAARVCRRTAPAGRRQMRAEDYTARKYEVAQTGERQFHAGKYYMILYLVQGSGYFAVEEQMRLLGTEDILLLKPGEQTKMHPGSGGYRRRILELRVRPEYLRELSGEGIRLDEGFAFVPYRVSVVHADSREAMLIKSLATELSEEKGQEACYGEALYEKNLLSMLLILTLRACVGADRVHKSRNRRHIRMDDIFVYIREHLTEDLTLADLEREFFVSRYHICREFKLLTGQTPHAYIVKARLDLCRKYLEQGKPASEVYRLGGFGGYNHFFRAFKKEYGMTPMQYYKSLQTGVPARSDYAVTSAESSTGQWSEP